MATEKIESEDRGGMMNERSWEETRREWIGWKNNINDTNMRAGGGSRDFFSIIDTQTHQYGCRHLYMK